jgi:glycosyltransferase involved in cell wall biosynthesis
MSGNGATSIGVTLYSDAAYYGGAEVYLTMLARHLDRERFRLSAIVPDDPPVPRLEWELDRVGVRIFRQRRPGFSWWESLPRLRRELRRIGGDVLHINLPSTYDAGLSSVAFSARLAGYSRVVTTEHLPMIRRRYRRFPMKVLFSEAVDGIIVLAEATRDDVVRLHHMPWEKTRLIPCGAEEPPQIPSAVEEELRAATATPRGMLTLAIVGTLTARKGHIYLFDALRILRDREGLPPLRLWVIGDGEDRKHLEIAARERGLGEIVRFTGARNDAAALMRLIDLLVVPSLMETTPFVILEAMAAGKPVIASRIYGIPEMVEEGKSGFLVRPGDAGDLARALALAISDRATRERLGRRGRARYEAIFTAERMARAVEDLYLGRERRAEPEPDRNFYPDLDAGLHPGLHPDLDPDIDAASGPEAHPPRTVKS